MEFLIYWAQEGKGKEESQSLRRSPIKGGLSERLKDKQQKHIFHT